MSTLNEMLDTYKNQRAAKLEEDKALFHRVLGSLFEAHPQIKTVYWAGYTPYFNDGDTCEFSVNEVHFSPVELDEIDGPYFGDESEDEAQSDFGSPTHDDRVTPQMHADMRAVSEFISTMEDVLLSLFEDHHFVRVSKDRVVREDYDHD